MGIAKKGLSVLLLIATLFSLSGCSDDEVADSLSPSPRPSHTPIRIQASNTSDLFGQWEQFDSEFSGLHQVAIINGDVIEIYWVNEETDAQYLYWSGSFPKEESIESSYSWVSVNNIEKAELSPLASWDETKDFAFEDGRISYSTTTQEVSATMWLEKNTWNPDLSTEEFFENETVPFSAAGIEFLIPDFLEKQDDQSSKWETYFRMTHGGAANILAFFEYAATQQDFDEKKNEIITDHVGEKAKGMEMYAVTVAGMEGCAFSYHMTNEHNVFINGYGTLVYNPLEEKVIIIDFWIPREESYQKFFNSIIDSATHKELIGDIEWDLAFDHRTITSTSYYLVDFDGGIAVHYFRGRDKKISGIYVGKISGSLDDVLDIAFESANGEVRHDYFTWKYPDKKGDSSISKLKANGEEDYDIYYTTSVDSAAGYAKNYIITP